MSNDKPVIMSQAMMARAISDPRFLALCPEFRTLKPKLATMKVKINKRGCRGCGERRIKQNIYRDFVTLVLSLGGDALTRLKSYLGVSRLMVNVEDPATKRPVVKVI
jgi:hypothetical protein